MTFLIASNILLILLVAFLIFKNVELNKYLDLLTKIWENDSKEWLAERKDLYNRLMSRDLADYVHHSEKKPKKTGTSNYLQEYRDSAYRNME